MSTIDLTHHFLIAMPAMADPYFAGSLTYVCEHNDRGALGVVINKPIEMNLRGLFERLELELSDERLANEPVLFGGPVQTDHGFVLHAPVGDWQATLRIGERIGLTTSKDILEAIGRGEGPKKVIVSLGYAGWAAGQLEQELSQNAWLTVEASEPILFHTPLEDRVAKALKLLGFDFTQLADVAGHA